MRRARALVAVVICGILLAGCGSDATTYDAAPTQSPTTSDLPGEPLDLPGRQVLYAEQRADVTTVSIGVRDDGRIVRTIPSVLTPATVTEPDGIDLYGGDVLGERGPGDRVAGGSFLLVGSAPGDVDVSVTYPDGSARPVTGSSSQMLADFTVFYVTGDWRDDWDQVQLAPLTVTTSAGGSAGVRERSWTG